MTTLHDPCPPTNPGREEEEQKRCPCCGGPLFSGIRSEDAIGRWIEDRTVFDPAAFTPSALLVASFNEYAGRDHGNITTIRRWLDQNHPGRVERIKRRYTSNSPLWGLSGIALRAGSPF